MGDYREFMRTRGPYKPKKKFQEALPVESTGITVPVEPVGVADTVRAES